MHKGREHQRGSLCDFTLSRSANEATLLAPACNNSAMQMQERVPGRSRAPHACTNLQSAPPPPRCRARARAPPLYAGPTSATAAASHRRRAGARARRRLCVLSESIDYIIHARAQRLDLRVPLHQGLLAVTEVDQRRNLRARVKASESFPPLTRWSHAAALVRNPGGCRETCRALPVS